MEEDMAAQIVEWQRRDFEAGYAPGGMPVIIHKLEPGTGPFPLQRASSVACRESNHANGYSVMITHWCNFTDPDASPRHVWTSDSHVVCV